MYRNRVTDLTLLENILTPCASSSESKGRTGLIPWETVEEREISFLFPPYEIHCQWTFANIANIFVAKTLFFSCSAVGTNSYKLHLFINLIINYSTQSGKIKKKNILFFWFYVEIKTFISENAFLYQIETGKFPLTNLIVYSIWVTADVGSYSEDWADLWGSLLGRKSSLK